MVDVGQVDTLLATYAPPVTSGALGAADPLAPLDTGNPGSFLNTLAAEMSLPADTTSSAVVDTAAAPADQAEISQVAAQLESLMLEMLLKQMWETIPKSELFGQGLDSKFYREMWIEELSKDLTENGPGIGLKAMLEQELTITDGRSVDPFMLGTE
ncbi:rod-binding protein [bacterium]|nr:rod-binding protein [bacterium]